MIKSVKVYDKQGILIGDIPFEEMEDLIVTTPVSWYVKDHFPLAVRFAVIIEKTKGCKTLDYKFAFPGNPTNTGIILPGKEDEKDYD